MWAGGAPAPIPITLMMSWFILISMFLNTSPWITKLILQSPDWDWEGGEEQGIQPLSFLLCRMKEIRRNKSHLGGQNRAQFPGTIGLRGRLELSRERCCQGHKSSKENYGSEMADIQDCTGNDKVFGWHGVEGCQGF